MATGSRYVSPFATAMTATNAPIPGAKLTFYLTGSNTPADTYQDAALTTKNLNPVTADVTGTFPNIFLDPTIIYKAVLQYPPAGVIPGAVIYTADPAETVPQSAASIPAALTASTGAGLIGTAVGSYTVEQRLVILDTEAAAATTALGTKAAATSIGSLIGLAMITATGTMPAAYIGYLIELSNAAAQVLTLPTAAAGNAARLVNIGAGTWTITAPTGYFLGNGISGAPTTFVLKAGTVANITFDGTNWVVDGRPPVQAWVNVIGSRASGAAYTNNTAAEIFVSLSIASNETGGDYSGTVTCDGVTVAYGFLGGTYTGHAAKQIGFPVPIGSTYQVNVGSGGTISIWAELR